MRNNLTPKQALRKLEMSAVCDNNMSVENAEDLREIIDQALTELEEIKQTMYSWEVKDTKQLNVALGEWTCGIKRQTNEDVKEEPILVKEDETDCQVVGHKQEKTLQECIESLECLFKFYQKDSEFNYQLSVNNSPFNIIKRNLTDYEKQTQILEVLKNKDVDLQNIKYSCNCEDYNEYIINEKDLLTEKEYDLLKEVLL